MLQLNPKGFQLVLGSKSPRRQELLKSLGYDFEIRSKEVDESFPKTMDTHSVAEFLAKKKVDAQLIDANSHELIICSDTVVIVHDRVLGKAKNAKEAKAMLKQLSKQQHTVITGVALANQEKQVSFSVETEVWFKELENEEMDYYIKNFQPFDKAGAYGIQEWIGYIGVEKIEGSFYNVMGLPLKEVYEAIQEF